MAAKDEKLLAVEDLVVEYTSGGSVIHAVNGVSFDLRQGETIGLVGETGAGKTTIAKTIMRILPAEQATVKNGRILLNGENLLEKKEAEMLDVRGKQISMIFQDPMTALNPVMSVGSQIAEVIALHSEVTKKEAEERALEMLRMVGITEERYDEFPFQFSGGMKQRIVIAIALACNPMLLLADEPTTALDVTIQAQVLEMINDLKAKLNTSLVLITHDLGVVAEMCDKVAVVYAGRIVEMGSKEDIFDHPSHPYTKGLFHSLPSFVLGEKRLHVIEGMPPDPSNLPEGCSFHPRCPYVTEACRSGEVPNKELTPSHYCRCRCI
ncbi:MAG: ABC transporter ATP-binding protein [Lachnospiraceae bacterium]|nr:ABC transporter ATP-binding protein [Lachnospiraceae bacterium]